MNRICLIGLLLLTGCVADGVKPSTEPATTRPAEVKRADVDFHGWRAMKLSNGTVDVVVVPAIARIVYYGRAGGDLADNVLWLNPQLVGQTFADADGETPWQNFGGDKAWAWPQYGAGGWQELFGIAGGWPPPQPFDRTPWTARFDGDAIVLDAPPAPAYGVRPSRRVALDPAGTGVTVTTTFTPTRPDPATRPAAAAAVWHVTQVPQGGGAAVVAGARDATYMLDGADHLHEFAPEVEPGVHAIRPLTEQAKAGFDADVVAAAISAGGKAMVFTQRIVAADGDAYAVPTDRVQIYAVPRSKPGDAPGYIELETTARVGHGSRLSVRWTLTPIAPASATDPAAVARVATGGS